MDMLRYINSFEIYFQNLKKISWEWSEIETCREQPRNK